MEISKRKIARFISVVGHPLITIPLYVIIVMFAFEDFKRASFVSLLIVGGIFIPLSVRLFLKSQNGSYTNFDVSDRQQRKSVFVFVLPLLILVTFILYKTGQSKGIFLGVLFATILTALSQIVNFFIKSSLHVSLNIFLSFLMMPLFFKLGICMLGLTAIIGWSRVVLGRHTKREVFFGAGVGTIISLIMLFYDGFLKF
jgi:hypothetical protein